MLAPNMSNSFLNQPHTTFSANRPPVTWSMVADIFATINGWISGTWQVASTVTERVSAPSAAAQVKLSNVVGLKSDGPP